MEDFKISLLAARVNANATQDEVCEKLGISKPTLISWEKGRTAPSIQQFRKLCELYKCPESIILF